MSGSIDHVLQPDGTYKWEVVEPEAKKLKFVLHQRKAKKDCQKEN